TGLSMTLRRWMKALVADPHSDDALADAVQAQFRLVQPRVTDVIRSIAMHRRAGLRRFVDVVQTQEVDIPVARFACNLSEFAVGRKNLAPNPFGFVRPDADTRDTWTVLIQLVDENRIPDHNDARDGRGVMNSVKDNSYATPHLGNAG